MQVIHVNNTVIKKALDIANSKVDKSSVAEHGVSETDSTEEWVNPLYVKESLAGVLRDDDVVNEDDDEGEVPSVNYMMNYVARAVDSGEDNTVNYSALRKTTPYNYEGDLIHAQGYSYKANLGPDIERYQNLMIINTSQGAYLYEEGTLVEEVQAPYRWFVAPSEEDQVAYGRVFKVERSGSNTSIDYPSRTYSGVAITNIWYDDAGIYIGYGTMGGAPVVLHGTEIDNLTITPISLAGQTPITQLVVTGEEDGYRVTTRHGQLLHYFTVDEGVLSGQALHAGETADSLAKASIGGRPFEVIVSDSSIKTYDDEEDSWNVMDTDDIVVTGSRLLLDSNLGLCFLYTPTNRQLRILTRYGWEEIDQIDLVENTTIIASTELEGEVLFFDEPGKLLRLISEDSVLEVAAKAGSKLGLGLTGETMVLKTITTGTPYTNNNSYPIQVLVTMNNVEVDDVVQSSIKVYLNEDMIISHFCRGEVADEDLINASATFIVPPRGRYSVTGSGTVKTCYVLE